MVEFLRPLVSFFQIVDDNLSNKSSNQHELKRLGVSEGGHLVADAVSVHEHEGARHLSTGPTSLLDFFSLPCDLGGYLLRRRSGLGGHHPGLVTFATHDLSPALEFWCRRRLEGHDLGHLPIARQCSGNGRRLLNPPSPRVRPAPCRRIGNRFGPLVVRGEDRVAANLAATALMVLAFHRWNVLKNEY